MTKILLCSTNQASSPYPVPPLGLALLYNRLKKRYTVRFIDGLSLTASQFSSLLHQFQPDFVGLSIRNIDDMVKGAAHSFLPGIKEKFVTPLKEYGKAPLILGGSGFTIFPLELMDYLDGDYGVVGEGEELGPALFDALSKGEETRSFSGVIHRGDLHRNKHLIPPHFASEYQVDLDLLLNYTPYKERGAYPIQTKRGCIHNCIYCSYPVLEGYHFRTREVSEIVDELEKTSERMADQDLVFEFVDSTFNDPPGHAEAICREIISRQLSVQLRTMGMNPSNISEELLTLMLEAGFSQIDVTPDSASPQMLKNFKKNFSHAQLVSAAEFIRRVDIPTMWFFIFGGPGETEETINESFTFIDSYVCSDDMVNITEGLRIYPKTKLAEIAYAENVIDKETSLLFPQFYVSSHLGEKRLSELLDQKIAARPNCLRLTETKPPKTLLRAAILERKKKNLTEPMFRTLLRLKRKMNL